MSECNVTQQELLDIARKKEPAQSANCTSPHDKSIYQYDSIDTLVCQALKLGRIAAEMGADVEYWNGKFIIKPKECDDEC